LEAGYPPRNQLRTFLISPPFALDIFDSSIYPMDNLDTSAHRNGQSSLPGKYPIRELVYHLLKVFSRSDKSYRRDPNNMASNFSFEISRLQSLTAFKPGGG